MLRSIAVRVRALLWRAATERELDEELRYHLEREIERNVRRGMSPEDARYAARRAFGNVTQHKDAARDSWQWRSLEELGQDVRYAWRGVRRAPVFALTIVLTIALGLGLSTSAFTIFSAYVLRPVAVRDAHELFQFTWVDRAQHTHAFTWSQYQALRRESDAFSATFAFRPLYTRIDGAPALGHLVTGEYFRMLGVGAAIGRTLLPEDAAAHGGGAVMVLSHRWWESRFAADSGIVGKTIRVRGYPLRVVGVAPNGFEGLGDTPLDFWAPIATLGALTELPDLFGATQPELLSVVGRVAPGLDIEAARVRLNVWARAHTADRPRREQAIGVLLFPRATTVPLSSDVVLLFSPIAAAFVVVLLIACANVANMMLARGMARQREIGIRLSLGAARARLVRQLLTESVFLALPAAAAAFAVSQATIALGVRLLFATLPFEVAPYIRVTPLAPDVRVFVFMVTAAVASALLFGLVPALQATRPRIVYATRGDFDTEFRPSRLRNALVVGQVTICALLLIAAGVVLRGARRLQRLDVGIRTQHVVELDVQERYRQRVVADLRVTPVVQAIAAATSGPLDGAFPSVSVAAEHSDRVHRAVYDFVTASYFRVLDIPIVHGRNFTDEEERSRAPVVIVSEAMARALWPNGDALGASLRIVDTLASVRSGLVSRRSARVVGIARNVVAGTIAHGLEQSALYHPTGVDVTGGQLLVRVSGSADEARRVLDRELTRIDSGAVDQIHTLDAYRVAAIYPFEVAYWVSGALGLIALLLTVVGIYGVLAYAVAQRRREFGIRMALGASGSLVVGLVLRQSLRFALFGLVLGGASALAVSRVFASYLVMIDLVDPVAYGGSMAIVVGACIAAAYVPSRRAATVNPVDALKTD